MLEPSLFSPGDEVVLANGTTGVLYARTWQIRKGPPRERPATWFFLPDQAAAVGLVVLSQPVDVSESAVLCKTGRRHGLWPGKNYRLGASLRQAVYVAHMAGRELPALPADAV